MAVLRLVPSLRRAPWRLAVASLVVLTLAACGTVSDTVDALNPFSDEFEAKLPGERLPVLERGTRLQVDGALSGDRVSLPKPFLNADWPQGGGNSAHAMYHLSLVADLPQEAWEVTVGEGADSDQHLLAQPLVVDGVVFTMDSLSTITALSAADGSLVWERDVEDEDEEDGYFGGGIAYNDGKIYVTTGFAKIFALSAANGDVLWTQTLSGPSRAAPTYSDGRLFVVTIDNKLHALAADDGRELWTHSGFTEAPGLLGSASPAVAGRTVIVPYTSGELYAVLAETGRVLWDDSLASAVRSDPLASIADIKGLPVIDREMAFAISHSGRMVAIDLRRGDRIWDVELGGTERPWAAGRYIYVLTNDAQVVCLRRADGRIRWVQSLPQWEDEEDEEDRIVWAGPVLAGDRLIVAGSHGEAWTLSPYDGRPIGRLRLPEGVPVAPVVADNSVYFLTNDAELIAYR